MIAPKAEIHSITIPSIFRYLRGLHGRISVSPVEGGPGQSFARSSALNPRRHAEPVELGLMGRSTSWVGRGNLDGMLDRIGPLGP